MQFRHLAFDHHDRVFATRHDDFHVGFFALRKRWINDEFTVNATDAYGRKRTVPNQIRQVQRGGSAGHGQHVASIDFVKRHDVRDDLGIDEPTFGEQRPHRAIHQPANQDFVVGGATFATKKAAWNFTGRIEFFLVLAAKRHEVDVARAARASGGDQHHSVAAAYNH